MFKRFKREIDINTKEIFNGSVTSFIMKGITLILGYFYAFLVTHSLGPKGWGIFSLTLMVLQVSSMVGRFGIDTTLLRFFSSYSNNKKCFYKQLYKKSLTIILGVSIFISINLFIFSKIMAVKIFHKDYLYRYFRVMSLFITPYAVLWTNSEIFRALKKIKEYLFFQQTGVILISTMLYYVLWISQRRTNFLIPIISYCLSILSLSIICAWVLYRVKWKKEENYSFRYGKTTEEFYFSSYKKIVRLSVPMMASNSFILMMGWVDTALLGILKTSTEVGIYNIALKLATFNSFFIISVNSIMAPKFAELWNKNKINTLENVAQKVNMVLFFISAPILIMFLLGAKEIMLIFGKDFTQGSSALRILSLGHFFNSISGSVGYFLLMTGYQDFYAKILFIVFWINVLLNRILIPIYGLLGASLATSITIVITNSIFYFYIRYKLGINMWRSLKLKL